MSNKDKFKRNIKITLITLSILLIIMIIPFFIYGNVITYLYEIFYLVDIVIIIGIFDILFEYYLYLKKDRDNNI